MKGARTALAGALVSLLFAPAGEGVRAQQTPAYEIHAVRFATLPAFRVSGLVAGADRARTMDIAMMVWVARLAPTSDQPARVVLIDAGFHREKFLRQWKPADYVRPDRAVEAALGIAPASVTDLVISHVHWDHADGVDLFPNARVWVQREEYEHHVAADGTPAARVIDPDVAAMLHGVRQQGRVHLIDGDDREIFPGVRVYTGGKHTYASQFVGVATNAGRVVLASDNAYLYENLQQRLAIAQTLDAASNLRAQARMLELAGGVAGVVPGHDPAVFDRFPLVKPGTARIR